MREKANAKVLAFCKSVMGGWRGRKAYLNVSDKPKRLTSLWDGGSRDTFHGIELATGKAVSLPISSNPFRPMADDYIPRAGVVIVEHSVFCGKDAGCTLHVHPDDAARFAE